MRVLHSAQEEDERLVESLAILHSIFLLVSVGTPWVESSAIAKWQRVLISVGRPITVSSPRMTARSSTFSSFGVLWLVEGLAPRPRRWERGAALIGSMIPSPLSPIGSVPLQPILAIILRACEL